MTAAVLKEPGAGAGAAPSTSSRVKRYRLATPAWSLPVLGFLIVFFIIPLIANGLRSFEVTDPTAGPLIYYQKLLLDPYYLGVLIETLKVAAITTAVCVVLGYPVAYFMVRYAGRWNALVVFCLIAPLLTSIIMRTFGWSVLFARRGLVNSVLVGTVLSRPLDILNDEIMVYIGLVHVLLPFMVLSTSAVLQAIDVRLEESARVLGASPMRAFLSVTLPLSLDGIATGAILVFVLTNGSFLTMLLLGGGKVTTLSLLIYQQFNLTQDVGFAAAMGNVLLVFALFCLWLQARFIRRRGVKS